MPGDTERMIRREFRELDLIGPPHGYAVTMLAPTVLAHGTEAQKERLVPAIARGEVTACQLFSEPEAGSDLASLRTRATPDGASWRIQGQKVWNSGALEADLGMLLARTDVEVPKHQGITYFVIPMDQEGIDVRPLRQMNGLSEFNETFLDGAVVADQDRVGPLHGGWGVAKTTLALERSAMPPTGLTVPAGERGGWLDRSLAEVTRATQEGPSRLAMFPRSGRAAIRLAQQSGRNRDPVIRQRVADLHIRSELQKLTSRRARFGGVPGAAQILKLQAADLARRARDVDLAILGASGAAQSDQRLDDVVLMALSAHVVSIGGGTDQVQQSILGERALGLPREFDVSQDVPFADLARSRTTTGEA